METMCNASKTFMSPRLSTTATSDLPMAIKSGWGTLNSRPSDVRMTNGRKPPVICLRSFSIFMSYLCAARTFLSTDHFLQRLPAVHEVLRATGEVVDSRLRGIDAEVVIER